MTLWHAFVIFVSQAAILCHAQVLTFEGGCLPNDCGWELSNIYCEPQLSVEGGWFHQHVELCPGNDPPGGQYAGYRRLLDEFDGAPDFFVEFRVESDAPHSELFSWSGGALLSIAGVGGVHYRFCVVRDGAWFHRDNLLPFIFPVFEPGVPHTHRLELYGTEQYVYYIDGELADAGVPEGQFPSSFPTINFRTYAAWGPSTTRWDYIRYGRLTHPTGDCNCDGSVNNFDIDPFVLAISDEAGYAAAHPGCNRVNADCDGDGRVDNFDVDAFVELLGG